jgi:hypothetical protein
MQQPGRELVRERVLSLLELPLPRAADRWRRPPQIYEVGTIDSAQNESSAVVDFVPGVRLKTERPAPVSSDRARSSMIRLCAYSTILHQSLHRETRHIPIDSPPALSSFPLLLIFVPLLVCPEFNIGVPRPCFAKRTMEIHGGRVVCLDLIGCASGFGRGSGL